MATNSDRKRVALPKDVETIVLTKCMRRCCLCWELEHKDNPVLGGQIAHLDHNPGNNDPDNLVWLCLAHHDLYDGTTSQSKGLTRAEVKHHRDRLHAALESGIDPVPGPVVPQVAINIGGDVTAGRDVSVHLVTQHITRPARGKKSPAPLLSGTVAEDAPKYNYLMYLVRRYNQIKCSDFGGGRGKLSGGVIHKSYEREMGCPVRHTPMERFDKAVAWLQRRIHNTRVGRINASHGQRLFRSFD